MQNYKELLVWKKSIILVQNIYQILKIFPKEEIYGLTSQIKRCTISVPSNIAEGVNRNTTKEFINFLYIARGSLSELETQLIIAKSLNFLSLQNFEILDTQIQEIGKMLNGLIKKLKNTNNKILNTRY